MGFKLKEYICPNFNEEKFLNAPNVSYGEVEIENVAPDNYHAMSIYPEYFKIDGKWILVKESRMDGVVVIKDNLELEVKEFRNLNIGDKVILGRCEDASEGIYLHVNGFSQIESENDVFAFRSGRSRETSYTKDYEQLYELLKYEKENGYVVWVLGPAAVFSKGSRDAMVTLIEKGYVNALFGGNAVGTHDLEGAMFNTALGQDIYTLESKHNGHYHHLDLLNKAKKAGSIEKLIENESINSGIIYECLKNNVPIILAGSIRDDGPLPIVISDVYKAQDIMRSYLKKATTVICLATQLHSIATGNMTPSYRVIDGKIRPIYFYSVDVSEFAVNKLRDRGSLEVTTIVTNIQDFLVNLKENL